MTERERDRMYQTALQQIAQQRAQAALASRATTPQAVPMRARPRAPRVTSGVVLVMLLSQAPIFAVKKESIYDGFRRWEHWSYCRSLFSHQRWYTDYVAYLSGC